MADIKACLFDLDGVIVDTAIYHYYAWSRLCKGFGYELSEEENEQLKGISRAESLNILLRKGGVEATEAQKQDMMALKNGWYLEYVNAMKPDEILPGVVHFLDLLKESSRKIGLGSASKNAMHIIEKIGLLPYFDVVIDGTKVTRGKPDPQTFSLGAEAVGVHPERCVVFEDAQAGIDAALAGGMYAIGVGKPEVLGHAHMVIPGFADIGLDILDAL